MRFMAFATRNRKEILRDPLTLMFGLGFPIVLTTLMSLMSSNIPEMPEIFSVANLAPGMAVFGLSFLSLFVGMLIAGDRDNAFAMRLFASPLRENDYILGYSLPMIPVGIAQCLICLLYGAIFGLRVDWYLLLTLVVLLPIVVLFIAFGFLIGAALNYRQVGGIATILINVAAWLSGTWFDLNMIGGAFKTIGYALPFAHAVDAVRASMAGNLGEILPHLWWVIGYAVVIFALASWLFRKKMKN